MKEMDEWEKDPLVKLGYYIAMTVRFESESEKGKKSIKKMKVIVFNQRSNPQTSVGSIVTGVKSLTFKSLFTVDALAILGFILLFLMVVMHNRLCLGYEDLDKERR